MASENTPRAADADAVRVASRSARIASLAGAWLALATGASATLAASAFSPRWREKLVRTAREFGYRHEVGPSPRLPVVPEDAVAPESTSITIQESVERDGNVTLRELLVLNRIVASRQPRAVFEIGTFDFRTTVNLAANAPDASVFTLDLPPDHPIAALPLANDDRKYLGRGSSLKRSAAVGDESRITALHGDSAEFDFTPYHGRMDAVFVDGAHSYEYARHDSETAMALASPAAMLIWHDYGVSPGVTAALNELLLTDPRFAGLCWIDGTSLAVLELTRR